MTITSNLSNLALITLGPSEEYEEMEHVGPAHGTLGCHAGDGTRRLFHDFLIFETKIRDSVKENQNK